MHTESLDPAKALERAASAFIELRPRLFGIAYRMLGSAAEAEDILQEVWLRWQNTDRATIENPSAFLATITTRLSINVAQSAHARRESYIGPWLPEPVDTSFDPALGAERGEALELALLLLLERLTPTERAAYVLREAFVYPYAQIAEILQLSQVNARQLVSRARKRLGAERREPIDKTEHRRLMKVFVAAAQTGDVAALEDLFAADVVSTSDGNGMRGAARFPLLGGDRVARFVAAYAPRFWSGADLTWVEVNGRAGVIVPRPNSAPTLLTIEGSPQGIHHVMWIVSPAKLDAFEQSRFRGRQQI
ncbi:RNA polymerase sigma-70 factor [Nonomuraea sp. K274]|uniref:RNA polymerase sigma-70 factor n=1 Tax=Nonomuraea cypriaca TaxID=1187855 RepID=A0A931A9H1_9ACTN|nr:RNA polymerase sigma-70 factor [Nonomuraea cypriaca]MBF8185267.1 RNA polymerase sigma-70 factor [Nonomuraea cypriaca]